ncbi:MAG: CoxG family protein [Ktedonobacterales bacterium]
MEIKGTHKFAASPQAVWDALHNSTILQNCLPSGNSAQWQGTEAIAATVGIGPIKGSTLAKVTQQTAPSHMKIEANGGGVAASLTVDLTADGMGTVANYNAVAEGGAAAGAGLAIAKPAIDSGINSFFTKLESQIK